MSKETDKTERIVLPVPTLRDYFAGQAMSGSLGGVPGQHLTPVNLARDSYAIADAMLKERDK